MLILVDTSAWSRFYRNDISSEDPTAGAVEQHLATEVVLSTGVVYLEVLRGFTRPTGRTRIEADFASIPFVEPTRPDYAGAADLSLTCRRAGVQLDTVDALIAQVCIANDLQLLTADGDFLHAARHVPLDVWTPV